MTKPDAEPALGDVTPLADAVGGALLAAALGDADAMPVTEGDCAALKLEQSVAPALTETSPVPICVAGGEGDSTPLGEAALLADGDGSTLSDGAALVAAAVDVANAAALADVDGAGLPLALTVASPVPTSVVGGDGDV